MLDEICWGHYAGVGPHDRDNKVLKVLNWNIGRGIRLTGVMEVIDREQPDICIFQEADLNTRRSGWRNLPDILAARFDFNYQSGHKYADRPELACCILSVRSQEEHADGPGGLL